MATNPDHPDAKLHPEATGLAAKLVKSRSAEQPLKLYAGWFCPFVQRVWLVLEEKKIPYQYIEVNPYHKPQSLLDINPRGLVPTVEYHGKPLYESNVICEFLEDSYPDHKPQLLSSDPYQKAYTRIWADFVTSRFIPSFHRFLQYQPVDENVSKETAAKELDEKRGEFLDVIKQLSKEMDRDGPYFSGKEPGLIDFILAPFAVRLWIFDHFKGGLGIPENGKGGDDEAIWQRWHTWLEAIQSRESVKNTTSDHEHYLPIYQRYADNTAQSELAKATRTGRGVP